MTAPSNIKIAGAPADLAAEPAAEAASADLFTQLMSTLVASPEAAVPQGDAATIPFLASPPVEIAAAPSMEGEETAEVKVQPAPGAEEEQEENAAALAGLFMVLPVPAAPVAKVSAESALTANAPINAMPAQAPAVILEAKDAIPSITPLADKPQVEEGIVQDKNASQPEAPESVAHLSKLAPGKVDMAAMARLMERQGEPHRPLAQLSAVLPVLSPRPSKAEPAELDRIAGSPLPAKADTLLPQILAVDAAQPSARPIDRPADIPSFTLPAGDEIMVERQLDLATSSEWLDQLAKDIAQTGGKDGQLRFRLNPETLGTLKVEVSHGHNGTTIRLTADTEAARSVIADAQPRLVAEARAQGVRIAETHVDLGGGQNGASADPRRQQDNANPHVRTARGDLRAEEQPDRAAAPGGSDRYA